MWTDIPHSCFCTVLNLLPFTGHNGVKWRSHWHHRLLFESTSTNCCAVSTPLFFLFFFTAFIGKHELMHSRFKNRDTEVYCFWFPLWGDWSHFRWSLFVHIKTNAELWLCGKAYSFAFMSNFTNLWHLDMSGTNNWLRSQNSGRYQHPSWQHKGLISRTPYFSQYFLKVEQSKEIDFFHFFP